MPYDGPNKSQIDKLINQLSNVEVRSGFGQQPLRKLAHSALSDARNTDAIYDECWEGAQNANDRQILAQIYLLSRDYYENIKNSTKIWETVFRDLGYSRADNPFMDFLDNHVYRNGPLDAESCRKFCNEYVAGNIDDSLFENANSFIYNSHLLDKNVDVGQYMQVYNYLSDKRVLDAYRTKLEEWTGKSLTDEQVKGYFLFGTLDSKENISPLVPLSSIGSTLKKFKPEGTSSKAEKPSRTIKSGDEDELERVIDDIKKLSDADRKELLGELTRLYGAK